MSLPALLRQSTTRYTRQTGFTLNVMPSLPIELTPRVFRTGAAKM